MLDSVIDEIDKDSIRAGLNKFTRRAFNTLPRLNNPRILDIGCGSGVPTIELARLSNGEIIGLDNDQGLLNRLEKKVYEEGLAGRVKTLNCSILDMDFPNESFNIIWSEGSIFVVGFKMGLVEWRRFLKPNGFMVVHDELKGFDRKIKQIPDCGYRLIDHFVLAKDIWRDEYYQPLEKRINKLRSKYENNVQAIDVLDREYREVEFFNKNPALCESVFYIMQKSEFR